MDAQGSLNYKAMKSSLILTNITIINFNFKEMNESDAIKDLFQKIETIKLTDSDIKIILVLRDAPLD